MTDKEIKKQMFYDSAIFGISGCLISEGIISYLTPFEIIQILEKLKSDPPKTCPECQNKNPNCWYCKTSKKSLAEQHGLWED